MGESAARPGLPVTSKVPLGGRTVGAEDSSQVEGPDRLKAEVLTVVVGRSRLVRRGDHVLAFGVGAEQ